MHTPEPVAKPETAPAPETAPEPEVQDSSPSADSVQECVKCRNASANPQTYCFGLPGRQMNPWGCRFSNMPWQAGAEWLKLGHFSDEATYIFDKKAIAEQLSLNLREVLDCPRLNTEYSEKAFDALPKRVTTGERWDYHQAEHNTPDSVTIKTTGYIHGCAVAKTVIVDAIAPVGIRDALKIVRKASRKINAPEIYKNLKKEIKG